jgi:hypothetical protein
LSLCLSAGASGQGLERQAEADDKQPGDDDVLLETGLIIQPLPIWEDEWEHPAHHPNPRLIENVRREGAPL